MKMQLTKQQRAAKLGAKASPWSKYPACPTGKAYDAYQKYQAKQKEGTK